MYFILGIIFLILNISLSVNIYRIPVRQRRFLFWVMMIFASVFIAMRPESCPDFFSYKKIFDYIEPKTNYGLNLLERHYQTGVEYGFVYFIGFMKSIVGKNYRLLWGAIAFATSTISVLTAKNIIIELGLVKEDKDNKYQFEIIISSLYFSYFFVCYEGIAIRGACSSCLCLVAFLLFIRKRYVPASIFLLLAFSMQRMAIVGAIAILVYMFVPYFKNKNNVKKIAILGTCVGVFLYVTPLYSNILIFMNKIYTRLFSKINYSGYVDGILYNATFDKKRLFLLFICVFVMKYLYENKEMGRLFNIYLIGIIVVVCTMNINGSARIYDYLTIYYIPLIACEYDYHKKERMFRLGFCLVLIVNYIISFRIWRVI